ncbi:MAG: zf-HC2 domain-containing protein [Acidobacteriota bacterium]
MKDKKVDTKCQRKEELVTYLYGECNSEEERSFQQHLRECAHCQREVSEFRAVREGLQSWQVETVPRITLDLTTARPRSLREILRELAAVLPAWFKYGTAFATTCSIVLVLLAVLNTQVRYNQEGFSFQIALFSPSAAPANPQPSVAELDEEAARTLIVKIINEQKAQMKQELETQIAQLTRDLSEKSSSALSRATLELKREQRERLQRALYELEHRQAPSDFEDNPFDLWGGLDEEQKRRIMDVGLGAN